MCCLVVIGVLLVWCACVVVVVDGVCLLCVVCVSVWVACLGMPPEGLVVCSVVLVSVSRDGLGRCWCEGSLAELLSSPLSSVGVQICASGFKSLMSL